ncbi:unnamed protein product [Gongylonema pulchrum]|uniref:Dolichyl-diphosphooligosaccharide--protein glycosyltransferase subunit STT3A n=1 Tax=Gongylonema pulchrum TaxID=637853 RepID=A0A183EU60_9BILA|nr:unnamed protein product [Gongylonema pulchrum]
MRINAQGVKDDAAGLVAASMIAVVPGYISRSVAGSYDNEGIAIFCMLFTYYLWIKGFEHITVFRNLVIFFLTIFYFFGIKVREYK